MEVIPNWSVIGGILEPYFTCNVEETSFDDWVRIECRVLIREQSTELISNLEGLDLKIILYGLPSRLATVRYGRPDSFSSAIQGLCHPADRFDIVPIPGDIEDPTDGDVGIAIVVNSFSDCCRGGVQHENTISAHLTQRHRICTSTPESIGAIVGNEFDYLSVGRLSSEGNF